MCGAGDTLFALGCGRLFEGTPAMMWASLSKLLPLPRQTSVFCAHEYTQVRSLGPPGGSKFRGKHSLQSTGWQ